MTPDLFGFAVLGLIAGYVFASLRIHSKRLKTIEARLKALGDKPERGP